jgi:hypothetical protein
LLEPNRTSAAEAMPRGDAALQAEEGYSGLPAGIGENLRFTEEVRRVKDRTVKTDGVRHGNLRLARLRIEDGKSEIEKAKIRKDPEIGKGKSGSLVDHV